VVSFPLATEEAGAMGREIESRQGKGWWLFRNKASQVLLKFGVLILCRNRGPTLELVVVSFQARTWYIGLKLAEIFGSEDPCLKVIGKFHVSENQRPILNFTPRGKL
jgi:hypothetical protein